MARRLAQTPVSDRGSDDAYQVVRARVLSRAVESAIVQAKKDASGKSKGAPLPPAALRPLLNFVRLPTAASRRVLEVLDSDEQFRHAVARSLTEDDLGRESWLFLHRPEGWSAELELLIESAVEEEDAVAAGAQGRTAERRLAQAEEAVARLKDELAEALDSAQSATDAIAAERADALKSAAQRNELEQRVEQLEQERQQAIRSMKDAEKRASARLDESRLAIARAEAAEQQVAQLEVQIVASQPEASNLHEAPATEISADEESLPSEVATSIWDCVEPSKIQDAVHHAAQAAAALGQQLELLARSVAPAVAEADLRLASEQARNSAASVDAADSDAADSDAAVRASAVAQRPPRRTPLRLLRGAIDGSVEGVEQLLSTPQIILIADGYNISMEAWPLLDGAAQRSSLLNMLAALQARTSALVHVVFDGEGAGSRPAVGAPLAVRVHFSKADVEADDVILDMVAGLPTDQPVIVVSSDRRVQDGARRLGANVVSSGQLLALTRSS
jgi:predicted RNA-binding protein with PIN domain